MTKSTNFAPWRSAGAMALGAIATASLVLLMQFLIRSDAASITERPHGAMLEFLPSITEPPPELKDPKPQEPPKPEPEPTTPRPRIVDDSSLTIGTDFAPPQISGPTGPIVGGAFDADVLPIVKVTPAYPSRALERGIEGYVLLQFTIDEIGRVVDASVIEAEPRGVFERAALKAVERFKYKPRVVNGQAIPVSGVQHRLTFELKG